MELLEKKPCAVYTGDPSIIFVRMIRRIDKFTPRSKLDLVYGLRAKFNDALNAGAARIEQHMLTLNSCNTSSHFDNWGKLSHRGRSAIWHEIDDLLERFDEGRVKLLPAPLKMKFKRAAHRPHDWSDEDNEFISPGC